MRESLTLRGVQGTPNAPVWAQQMQAQIQANQQQTQAQLEAQTQAIQALQQQVQANQQQVQVQLAKMHNSSSTRDTDALTVVPDVLGNIPPNFPATLRALNTLTVHCINSLFAFYNLAVAPGPDPLPTRRHTAVKRAVGIRTK